MIPDELRNVDKTKPMSAAKYELVKQLSDSDKRLVMSDFDSRGWTEEQIKCHYLAAHFPVVKYGPKWTLTPPPRGNKSGSF